MILKKFIKQFSGSSFPALIETEEGGQYILKMRGAGNGVISLVSEYITNKVTAALGWPVPGVRCIRIPDGFPWTFGTDEFDDIVQKSYGWNLGIDYIENAKETNLDKIPADKELFNLVYTIDLFFMNVDRTEHSNNLLQDGTGKTWIIDHGSTGLFQPLNRNGKELFPNHLFNRIVNMDDLQYDRRLHNTALFSTVIDSLPDEVVEEADLTKEYLKEIIHTRMHTLQ